MSSQEILIISFSNPCTDPRVNRQIRFLKNKYQVTYTGIASPNIEGVNFIPLTVSRSRLSEKSVHALKLLIGRYEAYYWDQDIVKDALSKICSVNSDLIVANDIDTLPMALKISKKRPVIYDAHEYAPRQGEDRILFRVFFQRYKTYLCKKYIPESTSVTTVCRSIARQYYKDTGLEPSIVMNMPEYEDLHPNMHCESRCTIRLIHHGIASPSRHLERTIELTHYLDERFELHLMLVPGSFSYLSRLKRLSRSKKNIHFLSPVPMRDIARYINRFDIGVFLLPPVNFNYKNALPNKFFEFIQARLAIAIGPSHEMAAIVKNHDLGVVSQNFTAKSLAKSINEISNEDIIRFKFNSHQIAQSYSSKTTRTYFMSLVERTLKNPPRSHCKRDVTDMT